MTLILAELTSYNVDYFFQKKKKLNCNILAIRTGLELKKAFFKCTNTTILTISISEVKTVFEFFIFPQNILKI